MWLMAPLVNSGLMLKLSNLFQTRNHLFQKRLFGEDVRDSLRLHDITSWAGISTARNNFAADGKLSSRIFAPYSIYKGKALLSAAPVLPTFSKLKSGDLKLDRHGAIILSFCPAIGTPSLLRRQQTRQCVVSFQSPFQLTGINGANTIACFARSFASKASESTRRKSSETRKDVSTVEDPFDAPTYNIPEKPVTFTEGASYSVIILAGLGIAAAAGYAVFKELIFQPKEYKIFGKALERIQNDNQVRVRIGSPVTGYGQESRNRAARQRIPNRTWTDEDSVEHVEVNFYIRGPHGAGKVYTEMFKDKVDNQWKFTYLIVEIKSPSPAQLMLESYVPA